MSLELIKAKQEEIAKDFEQFKKDNDAKILELKSKGTVDPTLEAKLVKHDQAFDTLTKSVDELKVAMQRIPANLGAIDEKDGMTDEVKEKWDRLLFSAKAVGNTAAIKDVKGAYNSFLRKIRMPVEALTDSERKALAVLSDPAGGYFVVPEMSSEMVKRIYESTPMRQICSVQSISTDALEIIEDLDEASVGWVGETQTRAETNTPAIAKIVIPVHELYAKPKATQKVLDDAFVNIEQWLMDKLIEKFGREEAYQFVNGNGVNKPKGFQAYTKLLDPASGLIPIDSIGYILSGADGDYTADDIIELFYALKRPYQANAKFLMNRAQFMKVRKFKETSTDNYLWQPGLSGGEPPTLMGVPVIQGDDMPALADGAYPVACGDFKAGYQIVDRFGIRVLRDPYTDKPYVQFYTTKRVGGGIKNFEAIKLLKADST